MSPSTDYSQTTTPLSATTTMSPISPLADRRPTNPSNQSIPSPVVQSMPFPPPPPLGGSRSTSRATADRLLPAMSMTNRASQPSQSPTSNVSSHQTTQALVYMDENHQTMIAIPPTSRRGCVDWRPRYTVLATRRPIFPTATGPAPGTTARASSAQSHSTRYADPKSVPTVRAGNLAAATSITRTTVPSASSTWHQSEYRASNTD